MSRPQESTEGTSATDSTEGPLREPGPVGALQQVLAAEHASVWVLGFLGARVPADDDALATVVRAAYEAHRGSRDRLAELLVARGSTPVAARSDYDLPEPAGTSAEVEAAARGLEQQLLAHYAVAIGQTAGEDRRRLTALLQEAAVRVLDLGAEPSDLPGLA